MARVSGGTTWPSRLVQWVRDGSPRRSSTRGPADPPTSSRVAFSMQCVKKPSWSGMSEATLNARALFDMNSCLPARMAP